MPLCKDSLGVVSIFKAGAAVPAVMVSSPEVKVSRSPVWRWKREDFPVGGLCRRCTVQTEPSRMCFLLLSATVRIENCFWSLFLFTFFRHAVV